MVGWLRFFDIGCLLFFCIFAGCNYTLGEVANQKSTPAPSWPLTEVVSADVGACEPQTVSGDSMVKAIMGSNLLTFNVTGADGAECLFDYTNETGSGSMHFSCRVPRSLGRVVVYQFDKGVSDIHGYRYGHQYSWDLGGQCTLAGCSEGTIFPADCAGR